MVIAQMTAIDFNGLAQYGALGFFVLYLLYREWKRDEKQVKMEDEMARKHNDLEEKFNKYMLEDRERITQALDNSTKVMGRVENALEKLIK